jgi:DUF4097 and DUF4098 domain-containing protein YvlB
MTAVGSLGYGPDMAQTSEIAVSEVRVTTTSGAVIVRSEPGLDGVISLGAPVEVDGATVTIDGGSTRAELRVPEGMDLVIGTSSGKVDVRGTVGSVAVVTTSGKVSVDSASSVDIRTASGKVDVDMVAGECRVVGGSGRVTIGCCGPAHVTTASGRITLGEVHGATHTHCASGRIDVTMATANDVDAETVSGRIVISMPAEVKVRLDTPSKAAVDVAGEYDCVVTARSGSGRVVVR